MLLQKLQPSQNKTGIRDPLSGGASQKLGLGFGNFKGFEIKGKSAE
jgi:hypothetical protein